MDAQIELTLVGIDMDRDGSDLFQNAISEIAREDSEWKFSPWSLSYAIASHNTNVVNFYNTTGNLARLEKQKNNLLLKHCSLLQC